MITKKTDEFEIRTHNKSTGTMTETIAIIAWGAMADVLYATPIVRHIRYMFPKAYIVWLVRSKFAEVIQTNPDVDAVVAYHLPEGHPTRQDAEYVMDQKILADANRDYDRVFDLQYWPRHSNFYERPSEDFISLRVRNAGLDPAELTNRKIVLEISQSDEHDALKFVLENVGYPDSDGIYPRFITCNHISYAASPVWSFDNYEKLVKLLDEKFIMAVFTGAPNEPIPEGAIDARGMPYMQWAELINMSDLWLGLDSGAVALACANDTPIVKLHSKDFPLEKTGIKAMGLRYENVLELCPAPCPKQMSDIIRGTMR
jgi:ADP-heptose:LPS heptosyltransferase